MACEHLYLFQFTVYAYQHISMLSIESYIFRHVVTMLFVFSCTDSVRHKGGCTFVHCMAGISRSATVCIAYLMKHLCWELQIAFDYLKSKRSCVAPNLSFMGQLLAFQQQLQFNHQSVLHLKNAASGKRTSPMSEETISLLSKSETHIKPNVEERVAQSPVKANRTSVDFCCAGNSTCSIEARKNGLKLLPLTKQNCVTVSVPNTC